MKSYLFLALLFTIGVASAQKNYYQQIEQSKKVIDSIVKTVKKYQKSSSKPSKKKPPTNQKFVLPTKPKRKPTNFQNSYASSCSVTIQSLPPLPPHTSPA